MTDLIDPRRLFEEGDPLVNRIDRMVAEKAAANDRAYRDAMAEAATKHYRETDPRRVFDDE